MTRNGARAELALPLLTCLPCCLLAYVLAQAHLLANLRQLLGVRIVLQPDSLPVNALAHCAVTHLLLPRYFRLPFYHLSKMIFLIWAFMPQTRVSAQTVFSISVLDLVALSHAGCDVCLSRFPRAVPAALREDN